MNDKDTRIKGIDKIQFRSFDDEAQIDKKIDEETYPNPPDTETQMVQKSLTRKKKQVKRTNDVSPHSEGEISEKDQEREICDKTKTEVIPRESTRRQPSSGSYLSPLSFIYKLRRQQSQNIRPCFNAKEVWRKVKNIIKAVYRLGYIAREIQLYGSPAFDKDDYHLERMIERAAQADKMANKNEWPTLLFHPAGMFKFIWSIIMILLLFYAAFITPLKLALVTEEEGSSVAWWTIQLTVDFLFCCDILVNFNSAYYDEEQNLVTSRFIILKEYAKFYFWIDLVASFPINEIFLLLKIKSKAGEYNNLLRLLRLPRFYDLLYN